MLFIYLFSYLFINDFCQTSYLKIYRTDPRQIFTADKTIAVDDPSETRFDPRKQQQSYKYL